MGDRYDQKAVSAVERGRSGLLMDGLAAAAKALDVSTDWLLGLTDDPTPAGQRAIHLTEMERFTAEERARHDAQTTFADPNAYRAIGIPEVASAIGSGTSIYDETPIGAVWFREDWLQEHGINSTRCNVVKVAGDSMKPTLPDGCSILVDRSRRRLRNLHIYVMRTHDGLIVKRVQQTQKGSLWLLVSDNIDWPTEVMDEDTDIIGEVRWYGVTL